MFLRASDVVNEVKYTSPNHKNGRGHIRKNLHSLVRLTGLAGAGNCLHGSPTGSSRCTVTGCGQTQRFKSWSYTGVTVLILDRSGFLSLERDGDLDGSLTTCLTMLPAWRATDRQTLKALAVVLIADEAEDLREIEDVEVAGVQVGDFE